VIGTRPEAIKMAPVVKAIKAVPGFEARLISTGQHKEMLYSALSLFGITPDIDLGLMKEGQTLDGLTAEILQGLTKLFIAEKPARVLVHGDTTTTLAASLAAYYAKVPLAHVEAGLRTDDIYSPWPEEINRRVTDVIADLFFAPTQGARERLSTEGVEAEKIIVTGNTVIDALLEIRAKLAASPELIASVDAKLPRLKPGRKLILVTGHRRESFGEAFRQICHALRRIAERGDTEIVYPVHLNPQVRAPVHDILRGAENVHLLEPLDYLTFVRAMDTATLIITDSGGVQEEAPSFGKPVLVMRDKTERPEAIAAGTAKLVGTCTERIFEAASLLLEDAETYRRMAFAHNPYGDGNAAERILDTLKRVHNLR
jgi:UDP-N-acetylglucosamine 2-epimerase